MHRQKREPRLRPSPKAGNERPILSTGRTWSGRALVLLGVLLLPGLCALLLIPTGGTRGEIHEAIGGEMTALVRNEAPALQSVATATTARDRMAVVEIVSPAVASPAAVSIPPLATCVSGALRDAVHEPIPGDASARVNFVDRSGRLRSCDAGPDGEYALHSLALGTQWVTVSADGYRTEVREIELCADRPRMRHDFTLEKAVKLFIKVITPDGRNLLDVLAESDAPTAARLLVPVATREPLGVGLQAADAGPGNSLRVGRFQERGSSADAFPPGCMGVLLLDGELPAWVSLVHHDEVLQTRIVDAGQDEVTFVISPDDVLSGTSTVRVQVLDALTGVPVHRARVILSGGNHSDRERITDEQGIATVADHAAGRFALQVRAKEHEELHMPVDVLPAGVTDVGTIVLEPEVTVAGRVLDSDGRPSREIFSLTSLDPMDRSPRWSRRAAFQSREDGSFAIRGLGRGEYVIRTGDHEPGADWKGIAAVSGNVLLDTRAGSILGVEVRLRPASKLVIHVSGRSATSKWFRALDERGLEVAAGMLQGSEPRALELPPGAYGLSLLGLGGTLAADHAVELGSDTVTLDLAPRVAATDRE